jgi:thiol-disulfide isomerase/thioredoxin
MKIVYIIGGVVVIALIGLFLFRSDSEVVVQPASDSVVTEVTQEEESTTRTSPNTIAAEAVVVTPTVVPSGIATEQLNTMQGALREYTSPADLANITGTNILFFKASWCPTCTALYDSLDAERSRIPKGVTIWVVDYDTNKDMRIKYGVTTQHTLVQIDTELEKIHLWRGGFSLDEVMSNIK